MPLQVTAIGKRPDRVAAVNCRRRSYACVINVATVKSSALQGPNANHGCSVHRVALPTRAVRGFRAAGSVVFTRRYSPQPLVRATNTPPPNLALQPKVNGLPSLGLHFILAQSRQSVAFG